MIQHQERCEFSHLKRWNAKDTFFFFHFILVKLSMNCVTRDQAYSEQAGSFSLL